jgi:hypothetical protein
MVMPQIARIKQTVDNNVAWRDMSDGRDDQLADLAHAFEAGFRQLDSHGRFPAETASALIARVRAHPNSALLSPTYLSEIFLGSFTGLPREAQAGIQEAIGRYDRLRLAGQEFGPAYLFLLRSLWRIRLRTRELTTRGGSLAKAGATAADVMCYGTRKLPDYARTKVRAASLKVAGRIGRGRSLGTVLACAGLDESDLVVDYARDVPQPPGYTADRMN